MVRFGAFHQSYHLLIAIVSLAGARLDSFSDLLLNAPELTRVPSTTSKSSSGPVSPEQEGEQLSPAHSIEKSDVDAFNDFLLQLGNNYEADTTPSAYQQAATDFTPSWMYSALYNAPTPTTTDSMPFSTTSPPALNNYTSSSTSTGNLYPSLDFNSKPTPSIVKPTAPLPARAQPAAHTSSSNNQSLYPSLNNFTLPNYGAYDHTGSYGRSLPPPQISSDFTREDTYRRMDLLMEAPPETALEKAQRLLGGRMHVAEPESMDGEDESDQRQSGDRFHSVSSLRSTTTSSVAPQRSISMHDDSESLRLPPIGAAAVIPARSHTLPSLRSVIGEALDQRPTSSAGSEGMSTLEEAVGDIAIHGTTTSSPSSVTSSSGRHRRHHIAALTRSNTSSESSNASDERDELASSGSEDEEDHPHKRSRMSRSRSNSTEMGPPPTDETEVVSPEQALKAKRLLIIRMLAVLGNDIFRSGLSARVAATA